MFYFRLDPEELYFRIRIDWPKWMPWFSNTWTWYNDWRLTKNKAAEVQIECDWNCLFEFTIQLNRCADHAGARLYLGLFKHWIGLTLYDIRHWNRDEDRYYTDKDHDDMMFTVEDANARVTEIAHKIKNGVKDDELVELFKQLPHYEMKFALIGKLAEWQYSTEANRVASILWNKALEDDWWIIKTDQKVKP